MTSAVSAPISSTTSCDANAKPTSPYQFTENPDTVTWNEQYYVYIERVGEFSETAGACWAQVYGNLDTIKSQVDVTKFCSFYRYDTKPKKYRAGVMVSAPPSSAPPSTLPTDFHCIKYPGGVYSRFTMTGDYSNLPIVCGRVDERVRELSIKKRDDWQIEYYKTDPKTTKPEENIVEILVPIIESKSTYKLTQDPDTVEWKSQHYVYVEREGPFKETAPACWQQLQLHIGEIKSQVTVDKYFSLYRDNCMEAPIYRAGVAVSSPPPTLPPSFHSMEFPGGLYARFTMTGDYSHLPEACERVYNRVGELKLTLRKDWFIENYLTDPKNTKPDENVTEILVPIESKPNYQFTENPDTVEWKSQYYVYVERQGPFLETAPACWKQLYSHVAEIKSQVTVEKYCSIYREDIEPPILRAGVTVSSPPTTLPDDFHCIQLSDGIYSRFTMIGDLINLPSVCQRVKERVKELNLNVCKNDWWIEYYATDCATTKPEENKTQILVPIHDKK